MINHVCADYDLFIRESIGIESRQFKPDKEHFLKSVLRAADSMYQARLTISPHELIDFKKTIMKELYTFEFKSFKVDKDAIDGVEFARSIVKYAQNNQKRRLLRRVSHIEKDIEGIKISEKEYVDFHFELQMNMKKLEELLKSRGVLTRPEIQNVLKDKDGKITEGEVEVLFRLLDADGTRNSIYRFGIRGEEGSLGCNLNSRLLLDCKIRRNLTFRAG
jgi:hypothetical protein